MFYLDNSDGISVSFLIKFKVIHKETSSRVLASACRSQVAGNTRVPIVSLFYFFPLLPTTRHEEAERSEGMKPLVRQCDAGVHLNQQAEHSVQMLRPLKHLSDSS